MVDRSLGWRRRAQLYDQLVSSLPKKYQKLVAQFAKTGDKSSSSSSSSSAGDSGANDPGGFWTNWLTRCLEMEAAGMGGAEMEGGAPGGAGGGMSGGMGGGGNF